ncbi:response regulator transcription factor [Chryseobacterium aquaticum]|uniref:Response regulator transcription factor n=1 Tax=Chryseobacterium aquaticum TaxID=452084 RepID=A0A848N3H1_9FLAO|nr:MULTISPECIES: response regulator transcription factor [Chryseobacterium]NMR33425.1 response regulator transcription factor [Chryseobacterium aquaticum]NRQ45499.1 response regulator transcription factor [Chryseobacterium sp. C-204]
MKNTIKIAVIDDHLIFLKGLVMLLEQDENLEVLYALNNHADLLNNIKTQTPDLLITDISMPEINGVELCKIIRKQYPEIKILVISSYSNTISSTDIDGYLLKDTDPETLIESIKKIVSKNEKVFYKDFQKVENFDFNKNIVSKREKEIINYISKGKTTEEIAEKLCISKRTVETHRKNIFIKLKVNNTAGLIKTSITLGLIDV